MSKPLRPPNTKTPQRPAAALVLHHTAHVELDPMFRSLCDESQRGIADVRLVPVSVIDFYPKPSELTHA